MFKNDFVTLEGQTHVYTSKDGRVFESVSRVLGKFKPFFDRNLISSRMAGGDQEKQQQILDEWDEKRDNASDHGTIRHKAIDLYLNRGIIDGNHTKLISQISDIIKSYHKIYGELICYDIKYGIAGTADLVCQRQKSKNPVIDIYDFKTNIERGIEYDSSRIKDSVLQWNNRYMLPTLGHLELANYNIYTLQLSAYAFMIQHTFDVRIGKLAILFIDKDENIIHVPVFYARDEVFAMFRHFNSLKSLPAQNESILFDPEKTSATSDYLDKFPEEWSE